MRISSILTLLFVNLMILNCSQDDPVSVYDENKAYNSNPVIESISPAEGALSGVDEITITGNNFSLNNEDNTIVIGQSTAEIISSSTTEIRLIAPTVTGDALPVKVATKGAIGFSNIVNYSIKVTISRYGDFDDRLDPYAIECDSDENLYVVDATSKQVYIVNTDGVSTSWVPLTTYTPSDMKFGPDGYLYLARTTKIINRVKAQMTKDEKWITAPGSIYCFDYDSNLGMYAGGKNDVMYYITKEGAATNAADYPNSIITQIRVFGNYVYAAAIDRADNSVAVWRNPIQSAGQLGTRENWFNWTAAMDSAEIKCMTFDATGNLLIGTNDEVAMIRVASDGSWAPYYPGVLQATTHAIIWGNQVYAYLICRNETNTALQGIFRVNMKTAGAPYYSRP